MLSWYSTFAVSFEWSSKYFRRRKWKLQPILFFFLTLKWTLYAKKKFLCCRHLFVICVSYSHECVPDVGQNRWNIKKAEKGTHSYVLNEMCNVNVYKCLFWYQRHKIKINFISLWYSNLLFETTDTHDK